MISVLWICYSGWQFYPITKRLRYYLAGSLKSGRELLVARDATLGGGLHAFIELYVVSTSTLDVELAARFPLIDIDGIPIFNGSLIVCSR